MQMTPEERKEYTEKLVQLLWPLLDRYGHLKACDILADVCREATSVPGTDYEHAMRIIELLGRV
jgi:hypothetical protein